MIDFKSYTYVYGVYIAVDKSQFTAGTLGFYVGVNEETREETFANPSKRKCDVQNDVGTEDNYGGAFNCQGLEG